MELLIDTYCITHYQTSKGNIFGKVYKDIMVHHPEHIETAAGGINRVLREKNHVFRCFVSIFCLLKIEYKRAGLFTNGWYVLPLHSHSSFFLLILHRN